MSFNASGRGGSFSRVRAERQTQSSLPQVNQAEVRRLMECAETKLDRFKGKVVRIDAHIRALEEERDSADVILEYFGLSKEREKLLLDVFVFPGEYGELAALNDWHKLKLEERREQMESSISFYQRRRQRRLDGIKFLERDIERLKKIETIRFQDRYFSLAWMES